MGSKVNTKDVAGGKWRRQWRLSGWGVEIWGFEMTVETKWVGSKVNSRDVAGGEWRRH